MSDSDETLDAAPIEPPPGDRLPIDADRDDIAAILMANWGVADNDEAAYDSACEDFDAIVAAEFRVIHAAAPPGDRLAEIRDALSEVYHSITAVPVLVGSRSEHEVWTIPPDSAIATLQRLLSALPDPAAAPLEPLGDRTEKEVSESARDSEAERTYRSTTVDRIIKAVRRVGNGLTPYGNGVSGVILLAYWQELEDAVDAAEPLGDERPNVSITLTGEAAAAYLTAHPPLIGATPAPVTPHREREEQSDAQ